MLTLILNHRALKTSLLMQPMPQPVTTKAANQILMLTSPMAKRMASQPSQRRCSARFRWSIRQLIPRCIAVVRRSVTRDVDHSAKSLRDKLLRSHASQRQRPTPVLVAVVVVARCLHRAVVVVVAQRLVVVVDAVVRRLHLQLHQRRRLHQMRVLRIPAR
jgi:hypothetical protein